MHGKSIVIVLAFVVLRAQSSLAGVVLSPGTAIQFGDGSMQTTAKPADHGGTGCTVSGLNSYVGGGSGNTTSADHATVSGGLSNTASGPYGATVGGGASNTASGGYASICGGFTNEATAYCSTIAGGVYNDAQGNTAAVVGGSGNTASGVASTVVGGYANSAGGDYSLAGGRQANASHNNSFVWNSYEAFKSSAADNTFNVWASGGIYLNGSIHASSDRDAKENIEPFDARTALEKVVSMPMTTWSYRDEDGGIRQAGPMAQDFYAAFGLGTDDKHIATIDADGVALAAIQGLNAEKDEEIASLKSALDVLRAQNAALEERLKQLEAAVSLER